MASSKYVHCPWCGKENVVPTLDGKHNCNYCDKPYFIRKQTTLVTSNREVTDLDRKRDS